MSSPRWLHLYGQAGAALSHGFFATRRFSSQRARDQAFRSLMASQWLDPEALLAEQWKRLESMLEHACERVPYYRRVMQEARISPRDIREPADLAALPLLTKEIIQAEGESLRATGQSAPGVYRNHTGGSTGNPLSFWQDAHYFAWGMAELDRNYWMCGFRPGWRQAFLWGSDHDSKAHRGLRGFAHDIILNLRWYNTFDLTPSKVARLVEELQVFKPHLIVGYVSALTAVARAALESGWTLPRPNAIQTSAESLTPSARALIEEAFGSRCFNRYGCREVGNIAHECEAHAGLHVLAENNFVELVPVTPTSDLRQVVVTNLRNRTMPFIRYATGDTGVPLEGPCSCGRGLPRIDSIDGRVSDVIVAPSGKLIHGEFFTHLFYGSEGIRQFQVEQTSLSELTIRCVAVDESAFGSIRDRVTRLIHEHGDRDFSLTWERLDRIPPSKSGKYRFTISRVPASAAQRQVHALDK